MDQDFLTVDELAAKLRVAKSWVYSKTRETGPDAIPVIRLGKYRRFRFEDVMRWIEKMDEKRED